VKENAPLLCDYTMDSQSENGIEIPVNWSDYHPSIDHYLLESTLNATFAREIIDRNPSILHDLDIRSQWNTDVLRVLLEHGYVPSENYIYHTFLFKKSDVIRLLHEFKIFDKVCMKESIENHCLDKSNADVCLELGLLSQKSYDEIKESLSEYYREWGV
jgi:hypothetical protein